MNAHYCLAHNTYCNWAGEIPPGAGNCEEVEQSADACVLATSFV